MDTAIRHRARSYTLLASTLAVFLATGTARACDGKSYSFDLAVG